METIKKISQKIFRFWPAIAGLFLLLLGLGVFQILRSDSSSNEQPDITTSTITTGDIRISAFGSGTLIAADEVQIAFEYGGIVEEVLVKAGDLVEEGDLLAVLSDDDLQLELAELEAELRELTSDAAVATAELELAEAQKDVLTAQSTLSFYLSPYVYKAEIRLQKAEAELASVMAEAKNNPSDEADQRVAEAQVAVENAELSLAMNYETYYAEYVPDFFNFPWVDRFGFRHDYYDPPSEIEVGLVWAELAEAQARVLETEYYLAAVSGEDVPEEAFGDNLLSFEEAAESVLDIEQELAATQLLAPCSGMVVDISLQANQEVSSGQVAASIAQTYPPLLAAYFDESDWSLVEIGKEVEVTFDLQPEKTYTGTITYLDPSLTSEEFTNMVYARIELDVSEEGWSGLPLSSKSSVELISGEVQDVVLLPLDGLQVDQGDQGMVLVENDGEFREQEVELGLREVLFAEVTSGLSAGDVVVVTFNQ